MKSFLELTKERFSVREYLPKDVEQEKLEYVMECVRMAWKLRRERLRRRSREREKGWRRERATRGVAEKGKWILGMIRFPKDKLLKSAPRNP